MALAAERREKGWRPSIETIGLSHEDRNPVPYVPQELLPDILSRLPVKSLLKFRCVNKLWASIIFNSEFIKSHLNMSDKYENSRLLLYNRYGHSLLVHSCSLPSKVLQTPFLNFIEFQTPFPKHSRLILHRHGRERRMLSSNGLVCILSRSLFCTLILWNPSTRKSRKLRNTSGRQPPYSKAFGFGYDELNDDYKVIDIFFPKGYHSLADLVVEVYSSKSNSWKGIKGYPSAVIRGDSDVLVNRALHWPNPHVIVSFNLVQETFGKVPLPDYKGHHSYTILGTFEDSLSLCCGYSCDHTDVWVMKEYGVKSSWTKLLSLCFLSRFHPAFISKGDKILICTYNKVVLYKSKNNQINKFEVHELPENGEYRDIVPYVESLALL